MSDFIAKITAVLDDSKVQKQLEQYRNGKYKTKIDVDSSAAQKSLDSLKLSFGQISKTKLEMDIFNAITNQCKDAVSAVKQLNDAMTLVSMTMPKMTGTGLDNLASQSINMAKDLSTYAKTVTDAVTIYANANESITGILNKAQPTVLLAAASGMNASNAADSIQGIMNQFDMAESEAMHVADSIEKLSSEIALDFSKGIGTISDAVSVGGSVMNEAGLSFEKYGAIVSATAEQTRISGSTLGNAFKTIASRITRSKTGEATEADMANAEKAFNSVGVSIRGADGDFQDLSITLDNLNKVWGSLNKSQKSYVAEQAAGVRNKNVFLAMMDTYDRSLELEEKAMNSSGTAMEINEKRIDSIDGKMQKLSATMSKVYTDAIPDDAVKGLLDFANACLNVVDNLGLLQGAFAAVGAYAVSKGIGKIVTNLSTISAFFTNPLTIGAAAIGGVVAVANAYQKSVQEMVASARQASDTWAEQDSTLQDSISKFEELRTALDSGNLTEQEAYDVKSQLLDIQSQLAESYGVQAQGIDLVNGKYDEQIARLNELSTAQSEQFLNENQKGINKAIKEMEKDIGGVGGILFGQFYKNGSGEYDAIMKSIESINKKYGKELFTIDEQLDGVTIDLRFNGNAEEAKGALNDFMTDMRVAQDELGESNLLSGFSDVASSNLTKVNEVLEEYQDIYNRAMKATLQSDNNDYGGGKTAAEWLNNYSKAVENYNNAVASGSNEEINNAKQYYENINDSVQKLIKGGSLSEYTSLFNEVNSQLDEANAKIADFNIGLAGDGINGFQKHLKSVVDDIKELDMSDVDFMAAITTGNIDAINYLSQAAENAGISTEDLTNSLVELGVVSSKSTDVENIIPDFKEFNSKAISAITAIQSVNSALANSKTGTGLTFELDEETGAVVGDLETIKSAYQDLAGYDAEVLFERTANGIHVNREALQALQQQQEAITKQNFIEQQIDLQNKLNQAMAERDKYVSGTDEFASAQSNIDALQAQLQTVNDLASAYDGATSKFNKFMNAASGGNERDSYQSVAESYTAMQETLNEGWYGDEQLNAYLDLLLSASQRTDDAYADFQKLNQTIEGTGRSLMDYFTFDDETGNLVTDGLYNFLDDVNTKLGDAYSSIENGEYTFDFTGQKLQEVADAFGTTPEMVELFARAMIDAGMKVKMAGDNIDDYTSKMNELTQQASEAQSKLQEMQKEGKISSDIDLNFDAADMSLDEITNKITELQNERIEIQASGDTEGLQAIDAEISALQNQKITMSIQAQLDSGVSVDQLLAMDNTQLAATLNVDTSQAEAARDILESMQGESVDTSVTVKIDQGQFDQLVNSASGKDINITANVTGAEQVDELKLKIDSLYPRTVAERANVYGTDDVEDLKNAIDSLYSKTVNATAITSGINSVNSLASAINSLSSKTVTVTTNYVTNRTSKATGTMLSPAHASGTAYNVLNMSKPAYANGKVSLSKNEQALVNEVGTESIVRDGVWRLLPGGAHIENLKKGDIVFSAQQTADLLRSGKTNGFARAYAYGTLANAYLSGTGGNRRPSGTSSSPASSGSGGSSSSVSSSTQSYTQNTSAVQSNTSATEENTEAAKESISTFDWVKSKLDVFARNVENISNKINDYLAFNIKSIYSKRQYNAISKEIAANEKAYEAYREKANSLGLSDEYKKLVVSGAFRIEDIDTSTDSGKKLADDIKAYQDYYEAAMDCKDAIADLNQEQLELFETIVRMPLDKAEKDLEKLENRINSINSMKDTASVGGSALSALQSIISTSSIKKAQKNLDTAIANEKSTRKVRSSASSTYKSVNSDRVDSGETLNKAMEQRSNSYAKTLRNAAKGNVSQSSYSAILKAIKNRTYVNTKGLKGNILKAAKEWNTALKQEKTVENRISTNTNIRPSNAPENIKELIAQWNKDNNAANSAKKELDKAISDHTKAQENLADAQFKNDSINRATTEEERTLANADLSLPTYKIQNQLLDEELKLLKEENKVNKQALSTATNRVDAGLKKQETLQNKLLANKTFLKALSTTQKEALKNGEMIDTAGLSGDQLKLAEQWNTRLSQTNILLDAQSDALNNLAESESAYAQAMVENEQQKLENISSYYDSMLTQFETRNNMLSSYMDRMQTQGYSLSTKFYEAQIANEEKNLESLKKQREEMQASFKDAVESGTIKVGTEEYYQMQSSIDAVSQSIIDAENNIISFQEAIRDLEWEQFDRLQDSISRITSESDFLIDLMSNKDMFDDTGKLTDEGLATMGLHGVNYNTYMAQADKYREEMERINSELANDPNNQKLIDRKNELLDLQQQSILSAEDEKQAIIDMVEDGINYELDSLQDLIDKYLDALDAQKDLYEYEKKIKDQVEEISSLEKQMAAYQGDDSEETRLKVQEIKAQLEDARDDLEETQYDKYISDTKSLLDNLFNEYELILNQRLDNVDALIEEVVANVNSGALDIQQTLVEQAAQVGYTLTPEMQNIWSATNDVVGVITTYSSEFSSVMTGVNSTISSIYSKQQDIINAINNMAQQYVDSVTEDTTPPTYTPPVVEEKPSTGGTTTKPSTSKPSTNTSTTTKPSTSKPSTNTSGGDGVAKVGDTCTFASGRYYFDSYGSSPTGNMYLGKKVKIRYINPNSPYPYAIYASDGTALGWVKLNQLKGYASGSKSIKEKMLAWTQENGSELVVRPSDGAVLTPLNRGDMVLNANATKNMWDMANDPANFIRHNIVDSSKVANVSPVGKMQSVDNHFDNIQFNLPNVKDSNDFINEMVNNKKFEKLVQSMTTDRLLGKSSLNKYRYRT